MSAKSTVRERLVEAAARLLADEGPKALSSRRLAGEVGASTMVVYTHFGGMSELVRAVGEEFLDRLAEHLAAVSPSADPVADLGRLAFAYRANALANPHLYAVMFGGAPLGGYRLPSDELIARRESEGKTTFGALVEAVGRAMEEGRFHEGDPIVVSAQMWSAIHGFVMLELSGHFNADKDVDNILGPLLLTLAYGLGDEPAATAHSMERVITSAER